MTIQITKVSVKQTMPKAYNILLNLKLTDGETELLNQDFSISYKTGQIVNEVINNIREKMQIAIDNYKAEQAIFTAAQLDAAIVTLKNSLTV